MPILLVYMRLHYVRHRVQISVLKHVLLPFADSACHSKEHTQELLQSLQKLFRQFYNHKD